MFLIFTTDYTHYSGHFFLVMLFSDEPEVFLPKYSQLAILHAAQFRRVVTVVISRVVAPMSIVVPGVVVLRVALPGTIVSRVIKLTTRIVRI